MKRLTEAECQRTIVEAAKRGGWLVHAERPAMRQSGKWSTPVQGHVGFPDLVLAHVGRGFLFVELKRKPNKLTDEQLRWMSTLYDCGFHDRAQVWWMPEELDARVQWLVNA